MVVGLNFAIIVGFNFNTSTVVFVTFVNVVIKGT